MPGVRTWATDRWGHLTCGSGLGLLSDAEARDLGFLTDADPTVPGASGTDGVAALPQAIVDDLGGLGRYVGTLTSRAEDVDVVGDTVVARDFTYGESPITTAVYPHASPDSVWAARGGRYAAGDERSLVFVSRRAGGIQVLTRDTATGDETSCRYLPTRPELDTRNGSTHLLPDGRVAVSWVDWKYDEDENSTDVTTHVRVLDDGAVVSSYEVEGSAPNVDASGDLLVTSGRWELTFTPTEEDLEDLVVRAHSLTTGEQVWERTATVDRRETVLAANLGPQGDSTLVAGTTPGSKLNALHDVVLVDATGEEVWRLDLAPHVSGAVDEHKDDGGSAWFVADDVLVLLSNDDGADTLQGVDIATGDVLWSVPAPPQDTSSVDRALTNALDLEYSAIEGRLGDAQELTGQATQTSPDTLVLLSWNAIGVLDLRDGSVRTVPLPELSTGDTLDHPELIASTSALSVLGGHENGAVLVRD